MVITVLFGLFGLMPAAIAAGKARRAGHPENRYWIAFGLSMAASVALYIVVVLAGLALLTRAVDPVAAEPAPKPPAGAPTTNSAERPSPEPSAGATDGTCDFVAADTISNPNLIEVGTPPAEVVTSGTTELTMNTSVGPIALTLDHTRAPCAAASFTYLASQQFFDGSLCHRLVNQPDFGVLQCGDPTGTGAGGPTYRYAEEITPETAYPRGTIAMAKTAQPSTTGSQFFLCFVDSALPPEYTVVGTFDQAGLAALETVAAGGIQGVGPNGDGPPAIPVAIERLTVTE